jgi:vacuolar-type H+-ATPase subunit H
MIKKTKKENLAVSEPPQKSLEKILKTEVQVAQKISEAKEQADRSVSAARDEVIELKEKIIDGARNDRERLLAEGIEAANNKAQEDLKTAREKSEQFFVNGQKFIATAAAKVLGIILQDGNGSL